MPMPGTQCEGGARQNQRDQQAGHRGLCHASSAPDGCSGRHSAVYQTAVANEGKLCLIAHRFNGSGVRVREVVQTNQRGFPERGLQVASACDSARREEFQTCISIRTVKRRERRAPDRGNRVLTLALIPAFSPRRRRIVRRFLEISCGGDGRSVVKQPAVGQRLFPPWGEGQGGEKETAPSRRVAIK